MGILGTLLYPDNEKLARELNEKEDKLRRTNNLHNDLVNSYRAVAEKTKTFDAYLMSIMVMQYYLAYTEEDLSNLDKTHLPELSKYWADTVETLAIDAFTIKMAVDGFKAISGGVANVFREGGIYERYVKSGATSTKELGAAAEETGLGESVLRTSDVANLTVEGEDATPLAGETMGNAQNIGEAIAKEQEPSEAASETKSTAADAKESSELAKGGEAGAEGGGAAVLGPALLVVMAVTEILSAIHEGQQHKALKAAAHKLDSSQDQLDKSVERVKKVFTKLLNAGKKDIEVYNELLPQIVAVEHAPALDHQFSTQGLATFIGEMQRISIEDSGVEGYQVGALQNLSDATDFIRQQALHDAAMTQIIKEIKTHMRKNGLKTLPDDDPFLQEVADVNSVSLAKVVTYNKFRVFVARLAKKLLPYHQKIQQTPSPSGVPKPPSEIPPSPDDPQFDPRPEDFRIPGPQQKAKAAA